MKLKNIQEKIDSTKIVWSCYPGRGMHVVGCPHRKWTKKELHDALIQKMKFEQSGLKGTTLS